MKPCLSTDACASAGVGGPSDSATEGFSLVEPEGGYVDQTDHVLRVCAEGGHDLTTVGVAGDDGRTVLKGEHLAQPGDVVGQRAQRKLRRSNLVTLSLKFFDHTAPG